MEHELAYPLLLPVGLLLIVGYLFGVVANQVKLPRIIGYVVAGVLLSPSVTGLLDPGLTQSYLGLLSALAVLHELRAAGPVTSTFLGVVALDDALTLVFFRRRRNCPSL